MDLSSVYYLALPAVLLYAGYVALRRDPLDAIPTVGATGWSSAVRNTIAFFRGGAPAMVQEGYEKYKGHAFKMARMGRWDVVVTGNKLVDEMRKAPDEYLSFSGAAHEALQTRYTMGPGIVDDEYHVPIVRSQLTRHLNALFPDVYDEVVASYTDNIPIGDEWITVKALDAMMDCVSRISNRVFVGLPKCRDPDWLDLGKSFTISVVMGAALVAPFPEFMRPLAARLVTNVPSNIRRGMKHMAPVIAARRKDMEEHQGEDWPEKPQDMLQWCMEEASGNEQSLRSLTLRMLTLNFAAIHTSSHSFTHALLHLAANPEYIKPLREEVDSIVREEGWSKSALRKMHKIDSFLKESQRMNGLGLITMTRKALQDFTFSDGTFIPRGTYVSAAESATHHDDEVYEDATHFNPFRFADMRDEDGEGTKHQFVSTNLDYLSFGHGRHACPGRFFAGQELALMLAHVVVTYDIRLASGTGRPANMWFATACVPANEPIMFRKRQD